MESNQPAPRPPADRLLGDAAVSHRDSTALWLRDPPRLSSPHCVRTSHPRLVCRSALRSFPAPAHPRPHDLSLRFSAVCRLCVCTCRSAIRSSVFHRNRAYCYCGTTTFILVERRERHALAVDRRDVAVDHASADHEASPGATGTLTKSRSAAASAALPRVRKSSNPLGASRAPASRAAADRTRAKAQAEAAGAIVGGRQSEPQRAHRLARVARFGRGAVVVGGGVRLVLVERRAHRQIARDLQQRRAAEARELRVRRQCASASSFVDSASPTTPAAPAAARSPATLS